MAGGKGGIFSFDLLVGRLGVLIRTLCCKPCKNPTKSGSPSAFELGRSCAHADHKHVLIAEPYQLSFDKVASNFTNSNALSAIGRVAGFFFFFRHSLVHPTKLWPICTRRNAAPPSPLDRSRTRSTPATTRNTAASNLPAAPYAIEGVANAPSPLRAWLRSHPRFLSRIHLD